VCLPRRALAGGKAISGAGKYRRVQIISSQLPAARGATRKLHYSRANVFQDIGRVCTGSTARHFRTAPAARRWWCLVGSGGSLDYHHSSLVDRCAKCLRAGLDAVRKHKFPRVRHQHQREPFRRNQLLACKLSYALVGRKAKRGREIGGEQIFY